MTVQLINTTEAWLGLRDDWDELVAGNSFPSVFMTFDYLWTAFGTFHQHDSELFLVAIHDARGELIGIAPFRRTRHRQQGFTLRVLEYVTTWEVDKPYPIFKVGCEEHCWNEIHGFLERHRSEWDALELMEVPVDLPATATLRQLFCAPAYQVVTQPGPAGPIIDLTQTWAQFLSAHPKYARALRRLGGVGSGYRLRVYDSADTIEAGIQA